MEYEKLISAAAKRQKVTEYRLAQMLGFKHPSAIYQVKRGKYGLSADKLAKLLTLAGKLMLLASMTVALHQPSEAIAQTDTSARDLTVLHVIRI